MIVPELPADVAELKQRVARFIEERVYPIEERIVARGSIDWLTVERLFIAGRCCDAAQRQLERQVIAGCLAKRSVAAHLA